MRTAFRGALEGAFLVGLGTLIASVLVQGTLAAAWRPVLPAALFGGVMGAIGRAIAGRILGAVLGGLVGIALGFAVGSPPVADYPFRTPATIPGGQELHITGPLLKGPTLDLRAWRGKVVLVDFWATWCPPCIAELPYLREVYERYHPDGLEVVGVSLDPSREQLEEFVARKQIPWPQIFFADERLRGWANPVARRYGIDAIPEMLLINREGRLVSAGLRGEALEPAVARLLGKEAGRSRNAGLLARTLGRSPFGSAVGVLLGGLAGCLGGAFLERALRRLGPRPA